MTKVKVDELTIEGIVYVPKQSQQLQAVNTDGLKAVLIRSDKAGVFFGFLKESNATAAGLIVKLLNTRRVYYWDGAASLSQMALEGVTKPKNCKFSVTLAEHQIVGVIEILPLTDKAYSNLNSVEIWRQ